MGSSGSKKSEDTTNIKAVEDMDEDELSSKDKLFKKAIEDLANEIKEVKSQKKLNLSTLFRKWTCVTGVYFRLIIFFI